MSFKHHAMYHGIIHYHTLLIRPELTIDFYMDLAGQAERDGTQLAVFAIPKLPSGGTNHLLIHHINQLIRTYRDELQDIPG